MALPRKLKHLNLFLDGENWIGVAEEYTPAKLAMKLEAYRGGGMPGAALFPAPAGMNREPPTTRFRLFSVPRARGDEPPA